MGRKQDHSAQGAIPSYFSSHSDPGQDFSAHEPDQFPGHQFPDYQFPDYQFPDHQVRQERYPASNPARRESAERSESIPNRAREYAYYGPGDPRIETPYPPVKRDKTFFYTCLGIIAGAAILIIAATITVAILFPKKTDISQVRQKTDISQVRQKTDISGKYHCSKDDQEQSQEVKTVLDNQGNINVPINSDHDSRLIYAANNGYNCTVRLLLNRRANSEAKNDYGYTALIAAAMNEKTDTVRLLLDRGANIEAKANTGRTALIWATYYGKATTVRLLLDHGANSEAKDNTGRTALIWAAYLGKIEIVRLLLDHGANIQATDNNGYTALYWAKLFNQSNTADLLRSRGAHE